MAGSRARGWLMSRGSTAGAAPVRISQGETMHLSKVKPLLDMVGDWKGFLAQEVGKEEADTFRLHERTGRPLGDERFVARLERLLGRQIRKRKPGKRPKETRK